MSNTYSYNFHEVVQLMYGVFLWIVCDRSNANTSAAHSHINATKFILRSLQRLPHIRLASNLNINRYL